MSLKDKYGSWALVAGGSEGIGAAFADYLARQGLNLFLVARNKEKLQNFCDFLTKAYAIEAIPIQCDLADRDACHQIIQQTKEKLIDILIYNAGLSYIGKFEENTSSHHQNILQINVMTQTLLIQALSKQMLEKKRGAVIVMSSLAGLQGAGFLTAYAATKAYCRVLGESLYYEWKDRGVDVISCIAGATSSPNFLNTKPADSGWIKPSVQKPEEVVAECFQRLGKTPSFVCGRGNKLASFIMHRLLPRWLAIKIMGDTTRKMYRIDQ